MDLIRERGLLGRKGSDNVKEWTKILEFTFDETENINPEEIDISNYTEFLIHGYALKNESNTVGKNEH